MKSKKPQKKKKVNTATNKVLRNRPNFLAQSVLIDARITGLVPSFTPQMNILITAQRDSASCLICQQHNFCFFLSFPSTCSYLQPVLQKGTKVSEKNTLVLTPCLHDIRETTHSTSLQTQSQYPQKYT